MSDPHETDRAQLVQRLRRDRCACLVLAEVLEKIAEEPEADKARQMDRIYGAAYLIDMVGASVDMAHLTLMTEEITAR